jgi:hypothetical protein
VERGTRSLRREWTGDEKGCENQAAALRGDRRASVFGVNDIDY